MILPPPDSLLTYFCTDLNLKSLREKHINKAQEPEALPFKPSRCLTHVLTLCDASGEN